MNTEKKFSDLGLSQNILQAIEKKGFKNPSPIQAGVIPLLLQGKKDILGQAQTGTGKTAAFSLPLLDLLDPSKKENQAIILTPTRELAIQVDKEIQSFIGGLNIQTMVVYGGNPLKYECIDLRKKPQIIVGTPGRLQHHIRNKNISMNTVKYFVLDEADEMLSFGFREEIEEILSLTPEDRRVLLFSATMPKSILQIAETYMGEYEQITVKAKEMTNENITQKYYCVHPKDKFQALERIIEMEEVFYSIVFCRTKLETDLVASQLAAKHFRAEAIHGDIEQNQREKILERFKTGKINILVATDVAARGIDVASLNFVVNYSLPENYEIYTHRIGRTGRAGNKGTAVTLIGGRELSRLRFFEKNLKTKIEKGVLPESKDIVAQKKMHLFTQVEHILNTSKLSSTLPIAKELLEEGNPEEVLAAVLEESFGKSFHEQSYKKIADDTPTGQEKRGGNRNGKFSRNRGGNRNRRDGHRGGNRNSGGRNRQRSRG